MSEQLTPDADAHLVALKYDPLVNIDHNECFNDHVSVSNGWNPRALVVADRVRIVVIATIAASPC
jgi:hypothetical protein